MLSLVFATRELVLLLVSLLSHLEEQMWELFWPIACLEIELKDLGLFDCRNWPIEEGSDCCLYNSASLIFEEYFLHLSRGKN